ncbi:MAG TPA: non-homologous end-joining DNA ligase [Polyangiales bacterium]|nr:non-homologous end-joining DNA ligase [Polyangiales bacterium]
MSKALPTWLQPMAATLTRERFTGPEWVFERKLDGIRLLAFKSEHEVRLLTRNQLLRNESYPTYAQAVAALPVRDAILDGEALGMWEQRGVPVGYHLFDVLWLDGTDLTGLGLDARRKLLSELPLSPPLYLVPRLEDARPWERACAEGWEGVIAKRRDAAYEHKRSRNWLKMKCEAGQELVIGGFTEPQGKRVGLGALLVGYFEAENFVFAGKVGTGFDTELLTALRSRLDALEVPRAPFTKGVGLPRRARWVRPEVVVEVAFMEWTPHGKLRHPRLVRLRDDKPARDVTRETP